MNLLADENIDQPIIDRLRQEGHDVWSVAEAEPGLTDDVVLSRTRATTAVLLTADKDFGELVFRLGRATNGVVLLRLAGLSLDQKAESVARVLSQHGDELQLAFTVITPKAVRIRRSS